MNSLLAFCLFAFAVGINAQTYTDRFDSIDIESILASDRLVNNYLKCFLNKGPCTPDGNEIKKSLPDALKTECSKCTEVQKQNADKVTNYVLAHKSDKYKELEVLYDPTGIYKKKYNDYWAIHDPSKVVA